MDLLSDVCDNHDMLTTVIEEALSVMAYELRFDGDTVLLPATALREPLLLPATAGVASKEF